MANEITIHLGDGFIAVSPTIPEKLTKALKYWHRGLEWSEAQMRRVATGEYRALYDVQHILTPDNQSVTRLVTMPGFAYRVKRLLQQEGFKLKFVDGRTPAPPYDMARAMEGLRDYQYQCAITAIASGGGVVACPTGYGKTHIMAAIIKAYSHEDLCARNTPLVVVATPDKDITRKDYEDLAGLLPGRDVGLAMSGVKKRFSDDVQVITLDSLHLLPANEIGILIVDEVHTAASEDRSATLMAIPKALRWGMSATPGGRFDGRDLVTEGLFGPVVFQCTYGDGVKAGALVPIKVYWIKAPIPPIGLEKFHKYKTRAGKYRNGVYCNRSLALTISAILKRTPPAHQAMCIMQYLEQMNLLAEYAPDVKRVHAETSQDNLALKGYTNLTAVSKDERVETYRVMASGELRQVMSTHVYKQGVNFPQLQVIINAGGGGSDIVAGQIPGRESRNTGEKDCSYLVDFWHEWDWELNKDERRVAGPILRDDQSREKIYTSLGFDQVWLDDIEGLPFLSPGQAPEPIKPVRYKFTAEQLELGV